MTKQRPLAQTFGGHPSHPQWHQKIEPEHGTKKAALSGGSSALVLKSIERAQSAINELAVHYEEWMVDDFEKLISASRIAAENPTRENAMAVFAAAQNVRGNASLFGYPAVWAAGDALSIALETVLELEGPYDALEPFMTATTMAFEHSKRDKGEATAEGIEEWLQSVKVLAVEFRRKYELRQKEGSVDS
ncbi:MAG: hypothetical protein AAGA88_13855 [Pseudomonadota bacterium]